MKEEKNIGSVQTIHVQLVFDKKSYIGLIVVEEWEFKHANLCLKYSTAALTQLYANTDTHIYIYIEKKKNMYINLQ